MIVKCVGYIHNMELCIEMISCSLVLLASFRCIYTCGERDFTKYNMFLNKHPCWSWNNIPINQSELRVNFSGNISCSLTIRVRCFYTLVNQLSFPTDFRNKLWVGLGLGVGIGLSLYFWTVMLIQDQQKMLIQEHVLLGKITATHIHVKAVSVPFCECKDMFCEDQRG